MLPIAAAALETDTLALADHADEDLARVAAYLEQTSERRGPIGGPLTPQQAS